MSDVLREASDALKRDADRAVGEAKKHDARADAPEISRRALEEARASHPAATEPEIAQLAARNIRVATFREMGLSSMLSDIGATEYSLGIELLGNDPQAKACAAGIVEAGNVSFIDTDSATLKLPPACKTLAAKLDLPSVSPLQTLDKTVNASVKLIDDSERMAKDEASDALKEAAAEERTFALSWLLPDGSSYSQVKLGKAAACSDEILKPENITFVAADSATLKLSAACVQLMGQGERKKGK